MKRPKITIIGAGKVGAATAQCCAAAELGDIVLLDIPATGTMSRGKALDLVESGPIIGFDARIIGTESYADTAGSDVVVITAGVPRRPGMSRDDLLATNVQIVGSVAEQVRPTSPEAVVIVVTNPLDAMAHRAWQVTGFPPARVVGQAGVVDTARFRAFIAAELNVSVEDVSTILLGGHGDTMVPLPNYTCVGGIPIAQLIRPNACRPSSAAPATAGPKSSPCCKPAAPITPRRRHRRDGRSDRPQQAAHASLLGLLRQGIWRGRLLRRRAGGPRRRRSRTDHRGRVVAVRAGRVREERRGGPRAGRGHDAA